TGLGMAIPIHTPRVNNNDDSVRFSHIYAAAGTSVRRGDPIADIETDKATFTVEAEQDGYVLGFCQPLGEMVAVGSVLLWMGASPSEALPAVEKPTEPSAAGNEPTLKAALLLARFGLRAADVPSTGERLSASDVLAYVQHHHLAARAGDTPFAMPPQPVPDLPKGTPMPLSVAERGMARTVEWHRDSAVPGYVEIAYPAGAWQKYADAFQKLHNTLMSPLLPLMAYGLVRIAAKNPRLNSTMTAGQRYAYENVNLGFTIQAGVSLYMLCI